MSYSYMGIGGKTFWFTGVVEDVTDPLQIGRAKVRAHGLHGPSNVILTEDLPWSTVLLPTTAGGGQGTRQTPGLDVGATVMGFFIDGASGQYPIIVGIIPGINGDTDLTAPDSGTLGQGRSGDGTSSSIVDTTPLPAAPPGSPNANLNDIISRLPLDQGRKNQLKADPCYMISYFEKELGLSRMQAAALVGNLAHESIGFSTTARNKGDGRDGSDSIGLAQWNSGRAQDLFRFANRLQKPWETLEVQLAFVVWEMQNTETAAYNALKSVNGNTVGDLYRATDTVQQKYERSAAGAGTADRRAFALGFFSGCPLTSSTGATTGGSSRF